MRIESAEKSGWFGVWVEQLTGDITLAKLAREVRDDYEHQATCKTLYGRNALEASCLAVNHDESFRRYKGWAKDDLDRMAQCYAA